MRRLGRARFRQSHVGFIGAAAGGILVALTHGLLCFVFRAEQVVSGVVLNILVLGLTTFGIGPVFGADLGRAAPTLQPISIPFLSDLPIVGRALFAQTPTVYLAFLLVPATWWLINRTTFGLALQAVGEAPAAGLSMGINVRRLRWFALIACGALAGIGGSQLTLAGLGTFTQNVTAGRGFIALAAVIFGSWRPFGTLLAVLLFTLVEAIQVRAQAFGIHLPYQFLVMAPYVGDCSGARRLRRPLSAAARARHQRLTGVLGFKVLEVLRPVHEALDPPAEQNVTQDLRGGRSVVAGLLQLRQHGRFLRVQINRHLRVRIGTLVNSGI